MSTDNPALHGAVLAPTSKGTPKRGYNCQRCLDYTTVVVRVDAGNGVTVERERPCPDCRPIGEAS